MATGSTAAPGLACEVLLALPQAGEAQTTTAMEPEGTLPQCWVAWKSEQPQ